MKVLLVADIDVSLPGGLETHLRELARALTMRGHEVDLLARPVPFPPFRTVSRYDPGRYDVVHHHTGGAPPRSDPRHVRTLHFCVAAKMDAYVRIGRVRTLANPANWRAVMDERAAVRKGVRFIAVSARVRDEFARFHGLDPGPVAVIPNGVAFAPARAGRTAWRAQNEIPEATPVLLTIGRRDYVKGHALLERAWSRLRELHPDALWMRVGDEAALREPGRRTTGPVRHEEVLEWIAAADVGALPSYYEGCSVALLEMVAGGLYALAHDVGNAAEVLRAGVTGEIVRRDHEAWVVALDRALNQWGRSRARTPGLSAEYGWDAIAARVEAVYREK